MVIISDSGATKADFVGLDFRGNEVFTTSTLGLNPEVIGPDVAKERLEENKELMASRDQVKEIYFYGAGCGTDCMKKFLQSILGDFFPNAKIVVEEDTYAAIYATVVPKQPAIVCILGTGSNCSYWDGSELHQKIESLGYTIMDDSSGNYYGKQLIRGYYFGQMPKDLAGKLEKEFDMNPDFLKEQLYKKPNPNRFLATFAKFMVLNKDYLYVQDLISEGFHTFIRNYILQYDNSKEVPIHFVGSIAYYLKKELAEVFEAYGLTLGNVRRRPIEGLVEYYKVHGL